MSHSGNGWSEYQQLVLSELNDLKAEQMRTRDALSKVGNEIAALKVKAGIWGGLAGLVPFVIYLISKGGH